MKVHALIVAAGRGVRAGGGLPKQYRPLAGRPVLAHSIAAFAGHARIDAVRVVIHPDDRSLYDRAAQGVDLPDPIAGGGERQDSVRLGLEALAPAAPDLVLIHDAARPLVDAATIDAAIDAAIAHGGAVAAIAVVDTLTRGRDGHTDGQIDRRGLFRAQTPQAFRFADILAAHRAAQGQALTDDAAVAERAGITVALSAGHEDNFKLTEPGDFPRAERILAARLADIRVGQGFDVHGFAPPGERALMLGGIDIPHDRGLAGHSDADVALHALTDAILGALAEGDIGRAFPPSDPQWKGAASHQFLAYAGDRVIKRGGMIAHLDLTIICEAPKIGPHRDAMRTRIADILGIDPARAAVKATTTERLGFTGRGEGIAVLATATIRLPL